jgi:Predicted ATPase (AAA+ superfamily)
VASAVTPWWNVLKLRDEVVHTSGSIDDVQMSLFQAVHGTVHNRPPYSEAPYYGQITHPSPLFTDLMAKVAVRLGGGEKYTRTPAAVWRLDQAMGGGKSHGLIGLYHLANSPVALGATDVGRVAFDKAAQILDQQLPADLNSPVVVVLACDNMTAGKGAAELDGPAQTLYERFLWRLFGGDNTLYLRYRDGYADKHRIIEALTAVGRPVLLLVDEILDYVRQLSLTENADLAIKDMAFLRALLESVNDVPNVAAVVVMIASEADNIDLDEAGQNRRNELDDLLIRNGKTATINDNTDFAAILRRRLFDGTAPAEVLTATSIAFTSKMTGPWSAKVFDLVPATASSDFAEEVARCYPFHPQLMAMAEQEWAKLAGFQRVRSTIRIFAATAHSQYRRGKAGEWAPLLVGPGDLPLSDPTVREAVINSGLIVDTRTQANYRQIASADIVAADDKRGAARELDRARTDGIIGPLNPRAAERAATCLFLCSVIGARAGGRQGATEAELKAAMSVPSSNYSVGEADTVIAELLDAEGGGLSSVEHLAGKGGQAPRLFMSTRRTLNMLAKAARTSITDDDRDAELATTAERLSVTGPFKTKPFIRADLKRDPLAVLSTAGIDDARATRLVVLDPRQFSLLNGIDRDTRDAIRAVMGIGPNKVPVQWASSAVFAIINTQGRAASRGAASAYLAWERVAGMDAVRADDELAEQARAERAEARRNLDSAVRRAYRHFVYLGEGDQDGEARVDRTVAFEPDSNKTSIDGGAVWKTLVAQGKAFDVSALTAKALLHNLDEKDYGRPLDELRDLFWSSPRLPLLPAGESDLQRAIFEAVSGGQLRLVGADDLDRSVTRAGDIAVGSSGLRLAPPKPPGHDAVLEGDGPTTGITGSGTATGSTDAGGTAPVGSTSGTAGGSAGGDKGTQQQAEPKEREIAFSLMTSMSDSGTSDAVRRLLLDLSNAVDEGDISWAQIQVKAIVAEDAAAKIVQDILDTGTNPSSRDV